MLKENKLSEARGKAGDQATTGFGLHLIELQSVIERFSIECRKTKTTVITSADQNERRYLLEPLRT